MKEKGFTLIEMVVTLIIGAILVLGIAGFVELGARGYSDTVDRQRLQTQAKFILEKMSREVRHAVPNMLNSSLAIPQATSCISFYPIVESGFYAVSGADLNFVVGRTGVTVSDINTLNMVINPIQASPTTNVFPLTNVSSASNTFTVPSAAVDLIGGSISNRHYIYNPNGMVSYCLVTGQLRRSVSGASALPLSDTGLTGTLTYEPATVQRNGIVQVDITFNNAAGDESTNFIQEIQVLNVP
ncbi:prepilin-type N-terminal cleavage/methylation domain-containing protein [Vibrio europaeus]|uniref:MSHA biogenesis protein MshO n=1 Tax=Vibrio europaeus TaxID=300876 RepID=A0A178JCC0_9VIBR|nr:prepilin-type N-terminal cleavage/methylation domain-containing protein [Vibrio europaeus]MDC5703928.1 prepilin-type N-terminal cleavage/methylation domain-containing protein [Vibrio europaeus]MDC5708864.1 prepilin-type N-terminal cleavage/methylation domain-containing protein [Vibrio europaeus]MDC5713342.1 prepilin-type N-terminal cleavage/methylation domain-containing protein [Vibrio europaeus]MDC5719095.1 prepilin-type N-terminal cleavage/methylation domain-containing protein [Vibrio euro